MLTRSRVQLGFLRPRAMVVGGGVAEQLESFGWDELGWPLTRVGFCQVW